ncbi:scabin-related ADP-ribosyltransferase [Paraburkholderia sp. MPAMCS5]|uniref:scabin-related ADP-ribosyltransferase n=1 Tax=Paraburkholderia sp. MPAMCS5 TaxID=3112563 RepID=UPI003FA7457C
MSCEGGGTGKQSGKQGFVFRGEGRSPNKVFNEGFQSLGKNTDLYSYALKNEPSIFVSTSKSPTVAREFAEMQGGGYVYTIKGRPRGVNVNAALGSNSPFPHELEVAVPGGIHPPDIMGAWEVDSNGGFPGPLIKNPAYVGN